jgi:hypothetical protein
VQFRTAFFILPCAAARALVSAAVSSDVLIIRLRLFNRLSGASVVVWLTGFVEHAINAAPAAVFVEAVGRAAA